MKTKDIKTNEIKTIEDLKTIKSNAESLTETDQTEQTLRLKIRTNEITTSFSIKLSLPDFSSVNVNVGAVFDVNEDDVGIEKFCNVASQCMHEVKRAVVEEVKKLGLAKRVEAIFTKEYNKLTNEES